MLAMKAGTGAVELSVEDTAIALIADESPVVLGLGDGSAVAMALDDGAVGFSQGEYIDIGVSGYPFYEGPFTVTPKAREGTVLPTAHTLLEGDITVLEVPYWETGNGTGITVYIAQEV